METEANTINIFIDVVKDIKDNIANTDIDIIESNISIPATRDGHPIAIKFLFAITNATFF